MIDQAEYARRRRQLMRTVGADAMVLVPAGRVCVRNGDVEYVFRQNSDFQYLSGFPEPEALLVLLPGRADGQCLLFCRERDPERERWDGPMLGLEGACEQFGMDDAFPISDIDDILPNLMEGRDRLYYTLGRDRDFDQQVLSWLSTIRSRVKMGSRPPEEFVSLDHYLHDMRLYKSRKEISAMAKAARISADSHRAAMRRSAPGVMEYELRAELLRVFHEHHAEASYQPIVGSGRNACIMHYIACGQALADGDLVLVDAGAEFDHYAADITRTFPANGRFSAPQKAVYEVVLRAQCAAIEALTPGACWNQPHDVAVACITEGLRDLGLLKGSLDGLLESEAYKRFYMHKTGHWLGMDVHDVGDYEIDGHPRELEPGMAMTIEPGIYIDDGDDIPPPFRNMGIRIEDSVVLTRGGPRVLSSAVPKAVDEIEALMA